MAPKPRSDAQNAEELKAMLHVIVDQLEAWGIIPCTPALPGYGLTNVSQSRMQLQAHSLTHSLTHPPTHPLARSLTRSPTPTHLLTQ